MAVVAGLVTAVLVLSWTRSQEQLTTVLLAAGEIPAGTVVEGADLRAVEIPAGTSLAGMLVAGGDRDGLVGQVAVRSISPGEPILYSDVRPVVAGEGRRAMSLPLPPAHAVGGRLGVGDRVDVLAVTDDGTRFVADHIPVLGVPDPDRGGLVGGSASWWVVLGVEDRDALEIAAATEHGTVYLLRSTGAPELTVLELTPQLATVPDSPVAPAVTGVGG